MVFHAAHDMVNNHRKSHDTHILHVCTFTQILPKV